VTAQQAADIVVSSYRQNKKTSQIDPITIAIILEIVQLLISKFGPLILEAIKKRLNSCHKMELRRAIWQSCPSAEYHDEHGEDLYDAFVTSAPEVQRIANSCIDEKR
jgi:hypothetical protein